MQENHIKLLLLYDSVLLNIVFQEQPSVQRLITSISATSRLSGRFLFSHSNASDEQSCH